jgi:UDP-glucose 4-epimerase
MEKKERVIILGGGFIASSIKSYLNKKNKPVLLIRKENIDLSISNELEKLLNIIKENDIIFVAAALAPVKNKFMYNYNIKIANNIFKILKKIKYSKLIYLSSDAVYSDTLKKINEKSKALPKSLHGKMHLRREKIFKKLKKTQLLFIRPTLVYGPNDPHNGYGPNKFIRESKIKSVINLFGKGEENRDHIFIDDLVKIVFKLIYGKYKGIFNIASGKIISFYKIANIIKKSSKKEIDIIFNPRKGEMPHKGYRAFDIYKIKKIFKNLKTKKITSYLIRELIKSY